jgi:hypothetical protein
MDKKDHLMAEKNKNNKDSQKGQVTPKNNNSLKVCKSKKRNKIHFIFHFTSHFENTLGRVLRFIKIDANTGLKVHFSSRFVLHVNAEKS